MKVAIIVNPLIPVPPEKYGGIERIVFMLIQELSKKGYAVTLFANENSKAGIELISYYESSPYNLGDAIRVNLLTVKLAFQNFDVVHTFGRMSNIALLMFSGVPKIVSYQLPPTLLQVKKAVKIARKNSLFFTACSDFIRRQIAPFGNVTTIYNGIDLNKYKLELDVRTDAPLMFLGRIQAEKGTAIAIQIAKLAGRKLIIAGNIPDEAIHQQYFRDEVAPYIDNSSIFYVGAVDDEQKNTLLGTAAALLMPVTWDEPFGIVMAESLACGTPVIGFKRGALPEIIIDNVNGFLVDSIAEMVAAVLKIKAIDRSICRNIAEERFSSALICESYESLYKSIINHP